MKNNLLACLLLFSSTLLLAVEENNTTVHPLIKEFDKNKDGKVFYSEASESLQEDFCQYDVNQDAYLDAVEIEAIPQRIQNEF